MKKRVAAVLVLTTVALSAFCVASGTMPVHSPWITPVVTYCFPENPDCPQLTLEPWTPAPLFVTSTPLGSTE